MTILDLQAIQQEQIKLRWKEPYVSAALNNKTYTTLPRGIYRGFEISPGSTDYEIIIDTVNPTGITGYEHGAFDSAVAIGYSVAIHENLEGHSCNIIMKRGQNSEYIFDLASYQGTSVFAVLDVDYKINFPTTAEIKIVDAAELDANPTLLVIGKIEVPIGNPITGGNIVYDDTNYPRVRPFADFYKDGFMTKEQASIVEVLSGAPGATNAFEEEFIVTSETVPQNILIPGGQQYVVGGYDLWVYKNGIRMTLNRDYAQKDDGIGFGTSVDWIGPLKIDDRIIFRGQAYAVALTNTLNVFDEGSQIQSNVTRMNFEGSGVLSLPDGNGRVRVVIPGASGTSTEKQKLNNTGATILRSKIVRLLSDGTIALCDPTDLNQIPFGITSQNINHGEYGSVVIGGLALNALVGVGGFTTGQQVYLTGSGDGSISHIPPDPLVSSVFKIGIADCADSTADSTPTDIALQITRVL